jgi:hypothetical protein
MGFKNFLKPKFELVDNNNDDYQNFRDQMNTIRAQAQQQSAMLGSQNIAGVLQNNPNSWMVESCSIEAAEYDPNNQTADVRIRFFDPQVASMFMWACRNFTQAAIYGTNPMLYTSSPIMQQAPEHEDKELNPGQHYVKDFGDD